MALILELGPYWMLEQDLGDPVAVVEIVRHAFECGHYLCLYRRCIIHELETTVQEAKQKWDKAHLQRLTDERILARMLCSNC